MPKTAADFLKELAIKAGVKIEDEKIKPLLAAPELANINIPDELITGIDNGLLSLDAAKNNHSVIKGHYFSQAYDGLDKELTRFIDDNKLPEEKRVTQYSMEKTIYHIIKEFSKMKYGSM